MRHRTVAHGETLVCVAFLLSFPNREQIPFFKPTALRNRDRIGDVLLVHLAIV